MIISARERNIWIPSFMELIMFNFQNTRLFGTLLVLSRVVFWQFRECKEKFLSNTDDLFYYCYNSKILFWQCSFNIKGCYCPKDIANKHWNYRSQFIYELCVSPPPIGPQFLINVFGIPKYEKNVNLCCCFNNYHPQCPIKWSK